MLYFFTEIEAQFRVARNYFLFCLIKLSFLAILNFLFPLLFGGDDGQLITEAYIFIPGPLKFLLDEDYAGSDVRRLFDR